MSYSVDNIVPINVLLTPSGLGFANFSSAFGYGVQADLNAGQTLADGSFRDYATLDEVGVDFDTASPPYLMARRWFAQIPKPPQFSVFMYDPIAQTPAEAAAAAAALAWRYWHFFPASVLGTEADVTGLADWADANGHHVAFTTTAANVIDPADDTDLASVLQARGNRHIFLGYRDPDTVAADASQEYAHVQLAAAFHKFRPEGLRTAITGEYQVLPGVVGESLATTAYNALVAKNVVFWTQIELQGSIDASRTINSKSMSSFGEFIDDVVNLDILRNRLQVNGFNYIANAGTKRPLTPRGYAGLLSTVDDTLKGFFDNGVLGQAQYTDPEDGEEKIAKYGYVIFSEPEDVFGLSDAQRRAREFPPVTALAILARAGHTAEINVTVE